ncbi:MAG: flagellar motor protein MotB [Bdellovibrio sp.]|nr:flagellar motor protein MotB [Bdellovibrio sp.]
MGDLSANKPSGVDTSMLWLVTYADMMTLICCFFILMMVFANYDPPGASKKMEEVSKAFNKDKYKSSNTKFTQLQEEIAKHPELKDLIKTSIVDNSLVVTFSGSILFDKESYDLTDESRFLLDSLIDLIKVKDANYRILVEGHDDNQALGKESKFTTHWGLSAARASSVVGRFEYFGFDPQNLVAIGLADTKPIVPNEDDKGDPLPENMRLNRRIVIKVLEPQNKSKMVRLGLGVYFTNDNKGE